MTILRLLDANLNRAAEGLRVLEDVARFLLDRADLAAEAKRLRHAVRAATPAGALGERDTTGDVGTVITVADEMRRSRPLDLVRANAARVGEALRCAEEGSKLAGGKGAEVLEQARYSAYRLESALCAAFPAWRLRRIRLYALVDTALCSDAVAVAGAVARGGAGAVQLRAKALAPRAYLDLARRVQEAVRGAGALFIVNDHAAAARILASDGLHLGQDDLPVAAARAVVGPACAIGLSAHSPEQARQAQVEGADYLGLGPMFPTATKPQEPSRGPELLDAVRDFLDRPSYAIGGLDAERIVALRQSLPHGVAVAAALCRAADPESEARRLAAVLGD